MGGRWDLCRRLRRYLLSPSVWNLAAVFLLSHPRRTAALQCSKALRADVALQCRRALVARPRPWSLHRQRKRWQVRHSQKDSAIIQFSMACSCAARDDPVERRLGAPMAPGEEGKGLRLAKLPAAIAGWPMQSRDDAWRGCCAKGRRRGRALRRTCQVVCGQGVAVKAGRIFPCAPLPP